MLKTWKVIGFITNFINPLNTTIYIDRKVNVQSLFYKMYLISNEDTAKHANLHGTDIIKFTTACMCPCWRINKMQLL